MNIAEILKNCPKGTKLYSPLIGDVELRNVFDDADKYPIMTVANNQQLIHFTHDGRYFHNCGECILFPSKNNKDWSTFKVPKEEYKFKPFDKVLVRDHDDATWICSFYSHKEDSDKYITINGITWKQCIPYENNQHLLDTTNKPE